MAKDTALYPHEQVKKDLPLITAAVVTVVTVYIFMLIALAIITPIDLANQQPVSVGCAGVFNPMVVIIFLIIIFLVNLIWWD